MNENLDLTKILEGCPRGTKFYNSVYGEIKFLEILTDRKNSIKMDGGIYLTSDGKILPDCGECTLFPSKDQRDWSKFKRFWDNKNVKRFNPKTFKPFDKVLVRDTHTASWNCDLYSHINYEYMANVVCVGDVWEMCIPYNYDTKHLVGTKEDCPEYYKWWEE